jgi:hypothetical protein
MATTNITGPSYYKRGSIQVWDFIRDQGLSFHLGNAIKYICRAGYKEDRISDLTKAIHYLQNELEHEILFKKEVEAERTSSRIQDRFPGEQQYDASFTDYATDFDR